MTAEFPQAPWDDDCSHDCRLLVQAAVREDLKNEYDWTTLALVPQDAEGEASMVAREAGVVAGMAAVPIVLEELNANVQWRPVLQDGNAVKPGDEIARIAGPARSLLTSERLLLNMMGRLSGIATLTRQYVDAAADASARIYDTRKTTPGWRRMEKYAVRLGGGWNHRLGLCDAVLIKDNHLAWGTGAEGDHCFSPAQAVTRAREFLAGLEAARPVDQWVVEIEVDTLAQFEEVLPSHPDIVLLDNMTSEQLREAIQLRDRIAADVVLEASGGVTLSSVARIAASGVDRISVGALTHSARWLDIGLDWRTPTAL